MVLQSETGSVTFEDRAARAFSQIASSRRRQGKPMSEFDA
jgi:hypothetical protein